MLKICFLILLIYCSLTHPLSYVKDFETDYTHLLSFHYTENDHIYTHVKSKSTRHEQIIFYNKGFNQETQIGDSKYSLYESVPLHFMYVAQSKK